MKLISTFNGCIASILFSLIIFSCNDVQYGTNDSSIKDSVDFESDDYVRLLKAHKNDELNNDSILLGFRLGMPLFETEAHLKQLISEGKIVAKDKKLFALIPANMICVSDKDEVHQFIAELALHIEEKTQTLSGIYASLYGPRFFIKPLNQRESESRLEENPLFEIYKNSYEKSGGKNFDSFYYAQKVASSQPDAIAGTINRVLYHDLLENYETKYGTVDRRLSSSMDETTHLWFSNGRVIKLSLRNDYVNIASEYLNREMPKSIDEFTGLVQIGNLTYSSVSEEIKLQQRISELSKEFGNSMDSMYEKRKEEEEQRIRKRAYSSGI